MFVSFCSNTKGVTSGAGAAYPSGAFEFTPRFLVWFVLLSRVLSIILSFFFWLLYCQSFLVHFRAILTIYLTYHLHPRWHIRPWCTASIFLRLWLLALPLSSCSSLFCLFLYLYRPSQSCFWSSNFTFAFKLPRQCCFCHLHFFIFKLSIWYLQIFRYIDGNTVRHYCMY